MSYRNRRPVGPAIFLAFAYAIAVISALTFSKSATAQFYHEWNGGTGNWFDSSNWPTDTVPGFAKVDGGDFHGDGVADTTDFNLWNGNKFTSITAVPEPKAGLLMLGGFVVLMFLSQRR